MTEKLTSEDLEEIVKNANSRSGACLTSDQCLEEIENQSPKEAVQKLKDMLTKDDFPLEELQDHLTILWVMHDIGKIQFSAKEYGLALSVQNIAKMEKAELATRLLQFLEKELTFVD